MKTVLVTSQRVDSFLRVNQGPWLLQRFYFWGVEIELGPSKESNKGLLTSLCIQMTL